MSEIKGPETNLDSSTDVSSESAMDSGFKQSLEADYQNAISEHSEKKSSEISDTQKAPEKREFTYSDGKTEMLTVSTEELSSKYEAALEAGDENAAKRVRALHEISTLEDSLQLTDGDADTPQLGGLHRDVQSKIPGFESHHMPSNASTDLSTRYGPAIALTKEDHALTDSYRARNNAKERESVFAPDIEPDDKSQKSRVAQLIDDGEFATAVRNDVYNIKANFGDKYDGALKQYFETVKDILCSQDIHGRKD